MTSPRRFEQDLPALLADLYLARTPDYRDDLVRQVDRVRQRPAWTFPERWLPMDLVTKAAPASPRVPWRTLGVLGLLAALLAAAVAMYVGSQPRLPEPFGLAANGLIAYDDSGDILVRESTTGPARELIGGDTEDHDPWFTPDGTRLTFVRTIDDRDFLMVADAHGGGIRQVVDDPLVGQWAAYAPDSRSLALVNEIKGIPRLAIIPLDGGAPLEIDLDGVVPTDLAWRPPDGRELLIRGKNRESDRRLLHRERRRERTSSSRSGPAQEFRSGLGQLRARLVPRWLKDRVQRRRTGQRGERWVLAGPHRRGGRQRPIVPCLLCPIDRSRRTGPRSRLTVRTSSFTVGSGIRPRTGGWPSCQPMVPRWPETSGRR